MSERRLRDIGVGARSTPPGSQAMLDTICEGVRLGLEGGETRLHVSISRELTRADGFVETEFVIVEGFKCATVECDREHHVRVHSTAPRYEYPDHLEHREHDA